MSRDVGSLLAALYLMARSGDVIRDTHGNVSCLDDDGTVWIKPSGMEYGSIHLDDLCTYDLQTGGPIGVFSRKPSVDLPHHLSVYRRHPWVRSVCHTHSPYAT